jgi:hypothetical protein
MILNLLIGLMACVALALGQTPGDDLFNKQDWAGAARAFQETVAKDAQDGHSWFLLGTSLHRLGRTAESREAYQKALENRFQPLQAMSAIARAYAKEGDMAKTVEWLDRAAQAGFAGLAFIDNDPGFAGVRGAAEYLRVREKIERNAHPCMADASYRQLDFWLGEWDVEVGGQVKAASRIERMLDGCVIQENWMPIGGSEGKSWNFYNSSTHKWEQVWVAPGSVLKLEGAFHDGAMRYEGVVVNPAGAAVLQRLTFTPMSEGRVHQLWLQSSDGGKTWTTAFDGIYIPKKKSQP